MLDCRRPGPLASDRVASTESESATRLTRVYLAGPMTGYPRWNFDTFDAGALLLRAHGFEVWSPHERDLEIGFDPDSDGSTFDLRGALEADVEALLECDLVALLPGWEESPGVTVELLAAEALGIDAVPLCSLVECDERIA